MNGPQKVYRETCEHCQYKDLPNGCDGCLASIAYDCEDERRHRIYYHEFGNTSREFRERCDIKAARCYKSPGILLRYCSSCPVGKMVGCKVKEIELPHASLRINKLIRDAQEVAKSLEEIAFDGVIDESERADFEDALRFLEELESCIKDVILIGFEHKKSSRSIKMETAACENN